MAKDGKFLKNVYIKWDTKHMLPKIFREYVYLHLLRNCTFPYKDFTCSRTLLQFFLPLSMAPGQRFVTFFLKLDSKQTQTNNSSFIVRIVKQGWVFWEEVIASRGRFLSRSSAREERRCYSRSWPWWVWRNNAEFVTWFKGLTCLFGQMLQRSY